MPRSKKLRTKRDSLVGCWRSAHDFFSHVEYRVSRQKVGYTVKVRDTNDGEVPDVFEVKWDAKKNVLSFATHWNSTGRFCRNRLAVTATDQVELTYTYTDTDVLVRTGRQSASAS